MKTSEFMDLVKKMRSAQRLYFKTRAPSDLAAAKSAEKQVDTVLANYTEIQLRKRQGELF